MPQSSIVINREFVEDSDSSDGTNPSTPKKSDRSNATFSAPKPIHNGQASPVTSPNRQQLQQQQQQQQQPPVGPSPKRTLFSRPSKMSIRTDAKDSGNKEQAKEAKDNSTSSTVTHYFVEQSSHHQTFSNLLKHAGNHVHHSTHNNNSSKNQTNSSASLYGALPRGKSFDMLRAAAAGDASYGTPISPSFFSSTGRSASFAAADTEDNWPLICARVLPLFNGEGLRQPIEDLNRLVSTHLRRLIDRHEESHLLEDLTELFETGTRSLDNNLSALPDEKLISRLSEIWVFYFSTVLPYLEATFLPVTIEFSNSPSSFFPPIPPTTSSSDSSHTSLPSSTTTTATTSIGANGGVVSVHSLACKSYRDMLILPLHARLLTLLTHSLPNILLLSHHGGSEIFSRLLQCISVLRRVQSGGDPGQLKMDELGRAVLFKKGRGDRRGIIAEKKPPPPPREQQGQQQQSINQSGGGGSGTNGGGNGGGDFGVVGVGKWRTEANDELGEVIDQDSPSPSPATADAAVHNMNEGDEEEQDEINDEDEMVQEQGDELGLAGVSGMREQQQQQQQRRARYHQI